MSTGGARTGDPRRVAKRALAAALIAMLMWGVAAMARTGRDHKSPGVRAGNSWSANMPMPEIDGVSWS